jgi:hypothetical protein
MFVRNKTKREWQRGLYASFVGVHQGKRRLVLMNGNLVL